MTFSFVALIAGFLILIKSADYLVDGSSSVAKRYGVSPLVIGLTIIAFGTSAPELVVNVFSAAKGSAPLAVGNILGSNLANLMLILGIAAILKPIRVRLRTVWREIPFMLLAAIMVLIMASDIWLDGGLENLLSRTNGLALLGFFFVFLYYSFISARQGKGEELEKIRDLGSLAAAVMIGGGLIGLFVGGNVLVESAVAIARGFGVSEGLIGLTVVAIGTSLPELASAIVAARKGLVDLAVGSVVGSNIFNIFLVLGLTSTITPLPFAPSNLVDAAIFVAASLLLFASVVVDKDRSIARWQGVVFVLAYLGYIAYSIFAYA